MNVRAHGRLCGAAFLFAAAGFALVAAPATVAAAADRVVLFSWDGNRRDIIDQMVHWQPISETPKECPNAKRPATMPQPCGDWLTCLPNLCQFQIIHSNDVEGKPLTKPQHAQMLTGYGPQETGEITNSGIAGVPEGMTLYEHLAAVRPEVRTVHIAGVKYVGRGVTRYALESGALNLFMRRGGRDSYTGVNTTDQVEEALDNFIITPDPFFLFVHYKAVDVVGHRSGDGSVQYREAMIALDTELGHVLQQLEDRGLLDGTKVYVTTDHGFSGEFHVNIDLPSVSQTWIASRDHDLVDSEAKILDVTPTILDAFGIDPTIFDPPYRGQSRLAH